MGGAEGRHPVRIAPSSVESPVPRRPGENMGHYARTLSAIIAALFATLLLSDAALAAPALVRVETPDTQSSFQAFVGRTAVDTKGPVTVTDSSNFANPAPDQLPCAADSPAAALAAVPGVSVSWLVNKAAATVVVSSIKGVKAPAPAPGTPQWSWIVYVDQQPVDDVCHASVPPGSEVLFFPGCDQGASGNVLSQCFTGGALYLRIDKDGPYPIAPTSVPVAQAPVEAHVIQSSRDGASLGPTPSASVTTDEGYRTTSNKDLLNPGVATLAFTDAGPHIVRASQGGWVPVRAPVCATAGKDGFCGTVKVDPPPFLV